MFESFIGVNFWTALFVLLNTIVLFLVLKRFLFVPVMNMIQQRQEEIDKLYSQANSAREEALAMETAYKEQLSQASQTGEQLVKEAVQRGQQREEEILRQAKEEVEAMMAKASSDIALEKKKMLNDAKNEISDIAMAIAEKVVARELKPSDHDALVDDFIHRLGEQT